MLAKKHKRRFTKQVPYLISGLVLFIIFSVVAASASYMFARRTEVVSPLAKKTSYNPDSIEGQLSKNNIQFSEIKIATDSSYLISLKDEGVVNLSNNKDIQEQITSLQLILARLTIEGKKFKRLDLRFDKPIILF